MSDLVTYEFINPSDAIVFDAASDEVAALAALVVGCGQCSARRTDAGRNDLVIGFAMFGGDGGYAQAYGRSIAEGFQALAADVVSACHSFRIANGERTSLTDWCRAAHAIQLGVAA